MALIPAPLAFTISTHRRLPGAALALLGRWGGVRFDTVADAENGARDIARGQPYKIEREHF